MLLMSESDATKMNDNTHRSRTERARHLQPEINREYIVPVLLKSIQILELLKNSRCGLRIERIQQKTGFAKTTVYRIVRTFVVGGYVRHHVNGTYTYQPGVSAVAPNASWSLKTLPSPPLTSSMPSARARC